VHFPQIFANAAVQHGGRRPCFPSDRPGTSSVGYHFPFLDHTCPAIFPATAANEQSRKVTMNFFFHSFLSHPFKFPIICFLTSTNILLQWYGHVIYKKTNMLEAHNPKTKNYCSTKPQTPLQVQGHLNLYYHSNSYAIDMTG
jgi:hypothetical protein